MICCQVKGKDFSQSIWQFWLKILAVTVLKPGVRICLMIILWYNYYVNFTISLKYGYCNFLKISHDNIPILAFHGPVKAKWLLKFRMVWPITAWIGVIYAFVIHLKNEILCIVRSFHEFHENVVIFATYAHILPNEKYRVISCDYRIKTQNIV